jgi:phytanoyl-CoA hydroxylase
MLTEDLTLQYENQGFLHLPNVIPQPLVARLRTAFDGAAARHQKEWEAAVAAGKASRSYYDIPNILDEDESFVELALLDSLLPVMLSVVGPDIQLNHTHARIFFPGKTFTAPWHSDLEHVVGVNLAHSPNFFVKVHYYFEDLLPDQGCLGFLPGTHRLPAGHPRPQVDEHSSAAVKIVPKAGDAVVFNTHLLHMALDNKTSLPRKSLIYAYSHFWVKHYANAVPSNVETFATDPLKRQMFGLEEDGVPYFNQRYNQNGKPAAPSSFMNASKKMLKRMLQRNSVQTR